MDHLDLILLFLLIAVTALTVLARRLDLPYPILLVVGGSVLGFVPGVPDVVLDPDVVLLVFLPPLLYDTALRTSRRDLRSNARPIAMSAIGLVLVTIIAVAVVAHAVVSDLPWAAAFALGAIVSPTDPLAAISIARRLGVPRRLLVLIEGESLVNDGTALVAYSTAVTATLGGSFSLLHAGGDFVIDVLGGAAVGWIVARILSWIFRRVDDDELTVTLSLLAGYAGYLPAEELGVSGVIAAVVVGLIIGHRITELSGPSARLRGFAFWDVLVFLLNAVLFVMVGLQLPGVLDNQDRSTATLLGLGAIAGAVVIATRVAWLNTMPYVVRALDRRPQQAARRVSWRPRMIIAWTGLRGAVSLAAALALPENFPERDLLIWMTLCVILGTLVLQGLTLPAVIRWSSVDEDEEPAREELLARKAAAGAALERIEQLRQEPWTRDDSADRLQAIYDFRRRRLTQRAGKLDDEPDDLDARSVAWQRMVRDVLDAQRRQLVDLRDDGSISDAVLFTVLRELDLEDQRLEI